MLIGVALLGALAVPYGLMWALATRAPGFGQRAWSHWLLWGIIGLNALTFVGFATYNLSWRGQVIEVALPALGWLLLGARWWQQRHVWGVGRRFGVGLLVCYPLLVAGAVMIDGIMGAIVGAPLAFFVPQSTHYRNDQLEIRTAGAGFLGSPPLEVIVPVGWVGERPLGRLPDADSLVGAWVGHQPPTLDSAVIRTAAAGAPTRHLYPPAPTAPLVLPVIRPAGR